MGFIEKRIQELEYDLKKSYEVIDPHPSDFRKRKSLKEAINHNRVLLGLVEKYDTEYNPEYLKDK